MVLDALVQLASEHLLSETAAQTSHGRDFLVGGLERGLYIFPFSWE